jgi:L-rhamnose mutarotase
MNLRKFLVLLLCSLTLAGCTKAPDTSSPAMNSVPTARAPQRFAWVTGLKPEKAAYYRELHAHAWPAVNRQIKASHIQNFSIYEREIEGKLYLFAYLEYTGRDFDADMARMAADPETQRWWKQTDPCQSPLPDALKAGRIWSDAKEIYHLD